jgi:non-specific serine/threonine protein kinase
MVEPLQRLAASLSPLWVNGHLSEGRDWLELALERSGEDTSARAKALNACATMAMEAGAGAEVGPLAEESARLYEQLGDEVGMARSHTIQAWAHESAGELDEARRLHEKAVALARHTGDAWRLQVALNNLGNWFLGQDDFAEAAKMLEEAVELTPMIGFQGAKARVLDNLGYARLGLGYWGGAYSRFRESMTIFSETGSTASTTDAFIGLAAVAAAQGRPQRSARLIGAADAVLEAIGRRLAGYEQRVREATLATLRRELADRTTILLAEGRALAREEAIAYALSGLD